MQRKKRSAPASRVPDDDLSDVENEGRRMDPPRDGAAADDGGGGVRAGRGVRRSSPRRVLRGRGCPPGRNRSSPAESVYQRRSERLAHVREAEGVRKYREQSANAFFHDGGGTGGAGGAGGGDGGNDSIGVHLEDLVNECVDESGVLRRTFVRAITAEDAMSERAIRVQKQEEKMLEQFKKAKSGEVTVVLVGEAGQGKSYLMNVFLRMADSGAGALIRHGMTSGRGLTPFVVYVHVNPLDDPTPQGISIDLFEVDSASALTSRTSRSRIACPLQQRYWIDLAETMLRRSDTSGLCTFVSVARVVRIPSCGWTRLATLIHKCMVTKLQPKTGPFWKGDAS